MKKLKFFIVLILFVFQFFNLSFSQSDSESVEEFRKIDNKAFAKGEKLTFDVKYGFITAGVAIMQIPRIKKMAGRDVFHITFEVNTVSSFDWIYKVRDRYETYLDVEGIFPWRFEQHIREGNYKRDFAAFFDQRRGNARTAEGSYEIPKYVNDIISAFYLARTFDYSNLKENDFIHLQNFYKNKVYPLDIKYLGKETIEVAAGKFDCIVIEPIIREGGLFKNDGNIVIWLTDDDIKMPVRVKTKVVIGSIDADLTSFESLKGNLTALRND